VFFRKLRQIFFSESLIQFSLRAENLLEQTLDCLKRSNIKSNLKLFKGLSKVYFKTNLLPFFLQEFLLSAYQGFVPSIDSQAPVTPMNCLNTNQGTLRSRSRSISIKRGQQDRNIVVEKVQKELLFKRNRSCPTDQLWAKVFSFLLIFIAKKERLF
jgi:hypothetical protein